VYAVQRRFEPGQILTAHDAVRPQHNDDETRHTLPFTANLAFRREQIQDRAQVTRQRGTELNLFTGAG
jgi:hypothetical protein